MTDYVIKKYHKLKRMSGEKGFEDMVLTFLTNDVINIIKKDIKEGCQVNVVKKHLDIRDWCADVLNKGREEWINR